MGRLEGKSAIVTGAASGIGRASAELFAREGARLVIFDKSENVHKTAETITAAGGVAVALTGDAGKEEDVAAMVAAALRSYGTIDACYANAGIATSGRGGGSLFETTVEEWQEVLRINLIGPFLMIKHAGKVMVANKKGSLICTASVAGIRSGAGPTPYSASKAGVINLVQTSANALAGTGVRVNAICPGLIETGMTKGTYVLARQRGTEDRIGQLNPLKRGGEPIEIANMALFLASDDASYVNGQAIAVDGGLSSSHPVTIRRAREDKERADAARADRP
jgi:NAD(P)-dependent dehydrogenase (short-subunit alcohol dehydrogenase family)